MCVFINSFAGLCTRNLYRKMYMNQRKHVCNRICCLLQSSSVNAPSQPTAVRHQKPRAPSPEPLKQTYGEHIPLRHTHYIVVDICTIVVISDVVNVKLYRKLIFRSFYCCCSCTYFISNFVGASRV